MSHRQTLQNFIFRIDFRQTLPDEMLFHKSLHYRLLNARKNQGCVANPKITVSPAKNWNFRKVVVFCPFWASRRIPYHNLKVFWRLKSCVLRCFVEFHENPPWTSVIPCHVRQTLPEICQLPQAPSGAGSGKSQGRRADIKNEKLCPDANSQGR